MMNYNIRGENIEVTPAIREYAEKKIGRLERYFNETPDANVHVNLKVYPDKMAKVEVTIPLPNLVLRAEERNQDMYAAIDLIVDKLERQIRKHKTKVNRKLREQGSTKELFTVNESGQSNAEEENDITIVRTKQFSLKPMDSEEAILQMNLLGHNFFIYTDAETNATNIVYRRKDGKYGLIETN
ncbi:MULTISPECIES: ribosome hibernation-promoting factor, HPF/YfiA family [Bacillus]|jgi:putative sigma-54 modulation protein|nr:ribosome-associated translation inhibitor RaiA [Bacillus smithii]AKP45848.1 Ribosomal subunit interface protein [Bacillus smithii]MED0660809.1 ribosome-associated translation inhibitor RaiA [Bacillus smithii]MED1419118.1 ribosome-associated translation inhibitor RaiA [Bacillus smithii]MED1454828.1 ribosome-associated translation inhibitor RaiA [Bacillus smithii]MED4883518.1 ribosome-associated translation inhibitor RaiA [Bacillus smithii]